MGEQSMPTHSNTLTSLVLNSNRISLSKRGVNSLLLTL